MNSRIFIGPVVGVLLLLMALQGVSGLPLYNSSCNTTEIQDEVVDTTVKVEGTTLMEVKQPVFKKINRDLFDGDFKEIKIHENDGIDQIFMILAVAAIVILLHSNRRRNREDTVPQEV
ncbi:hypothetical protein Ocin01_17897 [Orchesella cincta]|uniref:Uncharacterized protein n=1 Tax=Orchesella cincta TaxID=48709 RepID=A0A1D2M746_ORCCI|nr:hypothetical protein Ocin01_17897 [Orchesella cincta]